MVGFLAFYEVCRGYRCKLWNMELEKRRLFGTSRENSCLHLLKKGQIANRETSSTCTLRQPPSNARITFLTVSISLTVILNSTPNYIHRLHFKQVVHAFELFVFFQSECFMTYLLKLVCHFFFFLSFFDFCNTYLYRQLEAELSFRQRSVGVIV